MCIEETKFDVIDTFVVIQCLGPSYDGFFYLPAKGMHGGILLVWMMVVANVSNGILDSSFLTAYFSPLDDTPWWLSVVYEPQEDTNKIDFLIDLSNRRLLCPCPSLVIGDVNKNDSNIDRRMMLGSRGMFYRVYRLLLVGPF